MRFNGNFRFYIVIGNRFFSGREIFRIAIKFHRLGQRINIVR